MTRPFSLAALFGALGVFALSTGCASRAKVRAQAEEIEQLQRQLATVQRDQADLRTQSEQVRNQLFILHDRLETAETSLSRTTQAPPKLEVVKLVPKPSNDPLAARVRSVRPVPAPDPLDVEGYDPSADEAEMFSYAEAAPAAAIPLVPPGAPAGTPVKAMRDPVPDALEGTSTARPDEDPMKMYERAFALFKQKEFSDATVAFAEFVRANPTHEYADNAYYWMGECYYGEGEFALAIGEFQRVPELYPGGNKVPDALLKIGLSYLNLKHERHASKTLRQLVDAYPQSDAARIAKQRLAQIEKQQP